MTEPLQTILDRREAVIKILERDAQDAHDKLANAAAELHFLHYPGASYPRITIHVAADELETQT